MDTTDRAETRDLIPASGRLGSVARVHLTSGQIRDGRSLAVLPDYAVSVLDIPLKLKHGEYIWADDSRGLEPFSLWIDLRRQTISAYRGGDEIGTAIVVYGAPEMPSPTGRFKIVSKSRSYYSHSYGADMPFALFITHTGVAIHASPMSARHATHGCVGVPDAFAQNIFDAAKIGDSVTIVRSTGP